MAWYLCTVNQVGPASDATETPGMAVYINLTSTASDGFSSTWFYAADGIQNQLLKTGLAAITNQKVVAVAAVPPNSGNDPYTEISRIYELPPQPPVAPTGLHQVTLSPGVDNLPAILRVAWQDNSRDEDRFTVRYAGGRVGQSKVTIERVFAANSVAATLELVSGYTYDIDVIASNSAGETPSNTITVTVPPAVTTTSASLTANVRALPGPSFGYGLDIIGAHFGANEMLRLVVTWKIGDGDSADVLINHLTAGLDGSFQYWFTGNAPHGLCPANVPVGQSQPFQEFDVTATSLPGNKTASASATFRCPV